MDGIKIMQDLKGERERGRAREAETPVPGMWEIPAPKGAVWLLQGEAAAAAVPGVGGGVVGGVGTRRIRKYMASVHSLYRLPWPL